MLDANKGRGRAPLLTELFATDAEGSHKAVAQDFAEELSAVGQGIHAEEGDIVSAFCFLNDAAQAVELAVHIGHDHDALHLCGGEEHFEAFGVEVFGCDGAFRLYGVEGELAEVVAEGFAVQFILVVGGREVLEFWVFGSMDEYGLQVVVAGAQSAVQCDAVEPWASGSDTAAAKPGRR